MIQMGLVTLLSKFSVENLSDKELDIGIGDLGMSPKDGLPMRITKRAH